MKKILSTLVLAAAFAVQVQIVKAQIVDVPQFIVAAGGTSNLTTTTVVVDCSAQRNIALKWTVQLNGAGTEVMGFRLVPSVDGTLPSAPTLATGYVLQIAANGTTPVIVNTNFDTLGYRYLIGYYLTNGSSGQIVTNDLRYVVKRNAP